MSSTVTGSESIQEISGGFLKQSPVFEYLDKDDFESFKSLFTNTNSTNDNKFLLYEKNSDGKYVFDYEKYRDLVLKDFVNFYDMSYAFNRMNMDNDEFRNFLEKFPFLLTTMDSKGNNFLHSFAFWAKIRKDEKKSDFCKIILEKNKDLLESTDKEGCTVLFRAVETGNIELVDYLVNEKKANVNARAFKYPNLTPLMSVFYYQKQMPDPLPFDVVQEKIAEILLKAGADKNQVLNPGKEFNFYTDRIVKRSSRAYRLIESF